MNKTILERLNDISRADVLLGMLMHDFRVKIENDTDRLAGYFNALAEAVRSAQRHSEQISTICSSPEDFRRSPGFFRTAVFLHLQQSLAHHRVIADLVVQPEFSAATSVIDLSLKILAYLEMMTERPEDMISHADVSPHVWEIKTVREDVELYPVDHRET